MAEAAIQEAQAALEQAQISLSYTDIHAPIDGRISRADVSVGNLVGPESGVLATIVSQDPIYVTFPVSQRRLLEYRREQGDEGGDLVVRLTLPDDTLYQHPGEIDFLDVQVDPGTDTSRCGPSSPTPSACWSTANLSACGSRPASPCRCSQYRRRRSRSPGPYVLVVGEGEQVERGGSPWASRKVRWRWSRTA